MSSNTPSKKTGAKQNDKNTKKSTPFWKKHFLKLFLVLIILVSLGWGWISNNQLQKKHDKEMMELNESHKEEIIKFTELKNIEVLQTLALAVRSELIDENKDQVYQYFLQILKQPAVDKLMLIEHNSGKVMISTNKKDEGVKFQDQKLLNVKNVITFEKEGKWYTASPIMWLNSQLAVLVMVTSKK